MVLERRVEMCRSHTKIRTARLSERARDWKQSKNKMKKKKKKQWFTTWRSFFSVRFLWNSFVEKNQRLFMCRLFLVRIYVCFAFSYTLRSICYLPNLICRNKQHTHKKHIELRILNTCNETINSIQCSQRIFLYFFSRKNCEKYRNQFTRSTRRRNKATFVATFNKLLDLSKQR